MWSPSRSAGPTTARTGGSSWPICGAGTGSRSCGRAARDGPAMRGTPDQAQPTGGDAQPDQAGDGGARNRPAMADPDLAGAADRDGIGVIGAATDHVLLEVARGAAQVRRGPGRGRRVGGFRFRRGRPDPGERLPAPAPAGEPGSLLAPMPGILVRAEVSSGDAGPGRAAGARAGGDEDGAPDPGARRRDPGRAAGQARRAGGRPAKCWPSSPRRTHDRQHPGSRRPASSTLAVPEELVP